jgi:tetratricopeptide (TPR) repeat protein
VAMGRAASPRATRALALARRAVELGPQQGIFLNTLGVAEYRAGMYDQAIETLTRSLAVSGGQNGAFDLYFLAMAHHWLGQHAEARSCYERAERWLGEQKNLTAQYASELAVFRREAGRVLAAPRELPTDVFAGGR